MSSPHLRRHADLVQRFLANDQLYIHPTLTTDVIPNILDQANYTLPGCTLAQSNRTACTAIGNAALGESPSSLSPIS